MSRKRRVLAAKFKAKVALAAARGDKTVSHALLVNAESQELIGVAGQTIHYRKKQRSKKKRESASQMMKRARESEVWGKVIDQIGKPRNDEVEYIHVFDRGADNFEVYCRLLQNDGDWVIRASRMNRYVLDGQEQVQLRDYLPKLETVGRYTLSLRTRPQQPAREAELEVRVGRVKIPRPRHVSPWVRSLQQPPIAINVIEVVEVNARKNVKPIRWVLFTSLPVKTLNDAWTVIGYYESRWLIEEYHKAIKTGCSTESRQLKAAGRLEAFVGLTSVLAVRLRLS